MKELKCNYCGGTGIIMKDNGEYACDSCGITFTKNQIDKMRVRIDGTVEVEGVATIEKLVANSEAFLKLGEAEKAREVCTKIANEYPADYRGWYGIARTFIVKNQYPKTNIIGNLNQVAPEALYKEILNAIKNICPKNMVKVTRGIFQMGNTQSGREGESAKKPVHTVVLAYDYWIGKYEVTFDEFDAYCTTTRKSKPDDKGLGRGTMPVIGVTWQDAIGYCNWLSQKEGLKFAYNDGGSSLDENGSTTADITKVEGYRLPTEAEWEYAARGAQNSRGCEYSGSDDLDEVGWYGRNSGEKLHAVGQKKANELGTYDMSGNVWEWCYDWWGSYTSRECYSPAATQTNPVGHNSGSRRVVRGGSWAVDAQNCRVTYRYDRGNPSGHSDNLGFRLVRTVF